MRSSIFFSMILLAMSLHCKKEDGPARNQLMGTGESTTVRPLNESDRYLEAVRQGDLTAVRASLKAGADPNARDGHGSSALLLGARKTESLDLLRFLRKASAPDALHAADTAGRSPLSWAAGQGSPAVVQYLLAEGARLEQADRDGRTPLFHAVLAGRKEAARILIDAGAALDVQDRFGDTPLMMAGMKGRMELVRLLLASGADPALKNQEGQRAVDRVRDERIRALLAGS